MASVCFQLNLTPSPHMSQYAFSWITSKGQKSHLRMSRSHRRVQLRPGNVSKKILLTSQKIHLNRLSSSEVIVLWTMIAKNYFFQRRIHGTWKYPKLEKQWPGNLKNGRFDTAWCSWGSLNKPMEKKFTFRTYKKGENLPKEEQRSCF